MSFQKAKEYLVEKGYEDRIYQFEVSSATVALAAQALGVEGKKIAKSMAFWVDGVPTLVICAGDGKVSNQKFKAQFATKAKMLNFDEVSEYIGHMVGGVCPFGIKEGVKVYMDISLKRFDYIYPACGDSASAVKLSCDELFDLSGASSYVDVCNIIEEEN